MGDIASVIDEISKRLGVAASEIYSVLQAQARVQVIKSIVSCLVCLGFIALTCIFFKKVFCEKRNNGETIFEYHNDLEDGLEVLIVIGVVASAVISGILLLVLISEVNAAIDCIMNPKYWAINQILNRISQ